MKLFEILTESSEQQIQYEIDQAEQNIELIRKAIDENPHAKKKLIELIRKQRSRIVKLKKDLETERSRAEQADFWNKQGQRQDERKARKAERSRERNAEYEKEKQRRKLDKTLATGEAAGYWIMAEENGKRSWIPRFGTPSAMERDAMFPFKSLKNHRVGDVWQFQAYTLLPDTAVDSLPKDEKVLFKGLRNAILLEGNTDSIPTAEYDKLIEQATRVIMDNTQLHALPPEQMYVLTPATRSPIVKKFARAVAAHLNIPESNVLLDKFTKRTVADVKNDVEEAYMNNKLKDAEFQGLDQTLDQIINRFGPDSPIRMTHIYRQGDRGLLKRLGIPLQKVEGRIDLNTNNVPALMIVDDMKYTGSTAINASNLFIEASGVKPKETYGISLFEQSR